MAAHEHINPGQVPPEQLKMFMTARELGGYLGRYGDFGENYDKGALPHEVHTDKGGYKQAESEISGMAGSIAKEGVKKPLEIGHMFGSPELVNGHHRLIAQSNADPDRFIPVIHGLNGATVDARRAFPFERGRDEDPRGNDAAKWNDIPDNWHRIR